MRPIDPLAPWGDAKRAGRRQSRYALLLTALAVLGLLLALPYSIAILEQLGRLRRPLTASRIVSSVVAHALLSLVVVSLGLRLGRGIGLGWPPIDGWEAGTDRRARIRRALAAAVGAGAVSALFLGALAAAFPRLAQLREVTLPGPLVQTLASVGAGLNEEIMFRLGAMTFFAWAGAKLTRSDTPRAAVFWAANVLAALTFGAAHLPQASSLYGLTAAAVAFVLVGNGVVGVACGWLYWRKGLVAAMVAHATANLVLRLVLIPLGRNLGFA
jgi:hypothetical protein